MKRITLIILLIFVTIGVSLAFADSPVLFFSDFTSGPKTGGQNNKGAFVTVWGRNFGATRGPSYVSIGGGQVDNYPVWTDTKISFQLGPNATTGNIMVTTSDGASNGVQFIVRPGDIYFVRVDGNDTMADGSWHNPWRTIIKAKNSLSAGDIAYICDGVSQTTEDPTQPYGAAVNLGSAGTLNYPKALVAYPGAIVNIGSDSLGRGFHNWPVNGGSSGYWIISQFKLRSSGIVVPLGLGYRIVGNDITAPNGDGQTAAIEGNGTGGKILGNKFHNVGKLQPTKMYHNIYVDNNDAGTIISDIEIGWNVIHDSTANRGIQCYAGDSDGYIANITIHDNLIHDIRGNGININNHTTGTVIIYNNIIYKAGQGPRFIDGDTDYAGIFIGGGDATIYLYNNTIYSCGYANGVDYGSGLFDIQGFSGKIYPENNIWYSNGKRYEPYMAAGSNSPPRGAYYNLFYGKGSAHSWDTASINSDPKFINLGNYDFHLQAVSPVKDKGTSLVSSIVAKDYDGVSRPQGLRYDIGAYEYIYNK